MKKILILAISIAALVFTSCQQFEVYNKEANVTINVDFPSTKTISDGLKVNELYYELHYFDKDGNKHILDRGCKEFPKTKQLNLTLMRDCQFELLLWAQTAGVYIKDKTQFDLTNIPMNYKGVIGNDDTRDAFYYKRIFTVGEEGTVINATLTRPFSQLNFIASDFSNSIQSDGDIVATLGLTKSTIIVSGLASTFNVSMEAGNQENDPQPVTFEAESLVNENFPTQFSTTDTWLSTNYLLVLTDKVDVTASFDTKLIITGSTDTPPTYPTTPVVLKNVPVAENMRTNIHGEMFARNVNVNISHDAEYSKKDEDVLYPQN